MTFSILGFCEHTGMVGVATASSSVCVGSHCPWVRSGVGAVSVQYMADPTVAFDILDLLESGTDAAGAVAAAMNGRADANYRQVAAIDDSGSMAHYTGEHVEEIRSTVDGRYCVASGNVLGTSAVSRAMIDDFVSESGGHLANRLISALRAGLDAGGEKEALHSAALLIAHELQWPIVNLRVDWTEGCPVETLHELWLRYEPEVDSNVRWAIDPGGGVGT